MAAETKTTVVKVKPSSQDGSSKPKFDSSLTKKKISESSIKRPVDSKSKSTTTVSKTEVKVKTASSLSKTTSSSSTKTTTVKTREKKVYSLTGQKYDVPEEREPLRIFYESLSKQIPSSEMAEFWLAVGNLFSKDHFSKPAMLQGGRVFRRIKIEELSSIYNNKRIATTWIFASISSGHLSRRCNDY